MFGRITWSSSLRTRWSTLCPTMPIICHTLYIEVYNKLKSIYWGSDGRNGLHRLPIRGNTGDLFSSRGSLGQGSAGWILKIWVVDRMNQSKKSHSFKMCIDFVE